MSEVFAGIAGGVGLFIVGMWLLTENLKALASRRMRRIAARWTANRFSALLWGALAGSITQSMAALTFIVVSILRSGLIDTRGAFALILGGCVGVSALVVIVTLDIKVIALYVLGMAGTCVVSERLSHYRPIAASFLGGAMIITGLVLLKEAAAPLAEQPWFQDLLQGTGDSPALAFVAGAFLTALVQSSSVVSVFGISLAAVGVLSIDQAIMVMYGSCIGSGAIIYLLSAGLTGRSRQVAMYLVAYNALICAVLVPLLYVEIGFTIPLVKALVFSVNMELDQQLALVYVLLCVFLAPLMLAGLGGTARLFDRLWPSSAADALSVPKFIHDHASVDVDSSLALVDLEQRNALSSLSQYFDALRRGTSVRPLREAARKLLSDINEFLDDLQSAHPMQGVEDRNAMRNRQKLLTWLEEAIGALCEALAEIADESALEQFRASICESVDGVLLALVDAMEAGDAMSWDIARQLSGERGDMMRELREQFLEQKPPLPRLDLINVLLITNAVEETFFLLSKMEKEANPTGHRDEHVPQRSASDPYAAPRYPARSGRHGPARGSEAEARAAAPPPIARGHRRPPTPGGR